MAPGRVQSQIADKIEELMSQLNAGEAYMCKVKSLLKRYRQSVLKAAMEGKLTAQWREKNKDKIEPASELLKRILAERREKWEAEQLAKMKAKGKNPKNDDWKKKYKEPEPPDPTDPTDLPELPEGWCWVSLSQLTSLITKGSSPRWQGFEYVDHGIPFLRSQNVGWGQLILDDIAHLSPEFNLKEQKSVLMENDVLLNIVGASIGRAAVATSNIDGGNTNQAVAIIRMIPNSLQPELLVRFLISPQIQVDLDNEIVDVARANLSLADVSEILVPLMPRMEQVEILKEIDRQLSVCDSVTQTIGNQMSTANRLRQSILNDAFMGRLVTDHESDNTKPRIESDVRNNVK